MKNDNYSFTEFNFSSQIIRDLIAEKGSVEPFMASFFLEDKIIKQIERKEFSLRQRNLLANCLIAQNKDFELGQLSVNNITQLRNKNTFTITTGHQLNLLSGPLYSIYKIIQTICWTEKLNKKNKDLHFVPIFWMATEDHDFDEINHINLFNSKIEWQKKSQENFIAGKIETKNFDEFEDGVLNKFSDELLNTKITELLIYYKNTNLATATRKLLNDLFGTYGLVIIDGDDLELKREFYSVVKKELEHEITFNSVSKTNENLIKHGYHNQVFLRECNLFYIENHITRYRIVKTDRGFEINNKFFSKEELVQEAELYPNRFSPNALLRPVYQETILPNLVYIGGGGEIAYWLQLKELFDELNLTYPLLRVRDSYVLLTEKDVELLNELDYSVLDLKQNIDDLLKAYVKNNSTSDISMDDEVLLFKELKAKLMTKVESKDLGIKRFIEGELVKIENQLEKIEKKLIQNEKKNQDKTLKQIQRLKNKIYPNNGFQERYENFLQYTHKSSFIADLKKEAEQGLTEQPQIKIIKV